MTCVKAKYIDLTRFDYYRDVTQPYYTPIVTKTTICPALDLTAFASAHTFTGISIDDCVTSCKGVGGVSFKYRIMNEPNLLWKGGCLVQTAG